LFLAVTPNSEQIFTPHSALTYRIGEKRREFNAAATKVMKTGLSLPRDLAELPAKRDYG
jgi:hypothetical protein